MDSTVLQLVRAHRVIAILRLDDLSQIESIVRALLEGGIRAIELTLTNAEAPHWVSTLRQRVADFANGDAALGIGSIRTVQEARLALEAGAQFIVCPITDPRIIALSQQMGTPVMPGAFTPTEAHQAWELGADLVKIFPAKSLGPDFIRDLLAPMPYLRLMPTGGVQRNNIQSYLQAGAIAVGIGSQLVPKQALLNKDWSAIVEVAADYARLTETGSQYDPRI